MSIDFNKFSDGSINTSVPDSPSWQGTGVFDKLIQAINGNIKVQYDTGRITGAEYAHVYLGGMQTAVTEAMKFVLNEDSIAKDLEVKDIQIAIQEVQLAENSEKWALQKQVLENQLDMSNVDVANKASHAAKDLTIKDKQIESATADIAFNTSKKTIMEQTRKDNIRSKAAEQFAEFMKYISAANVVPGNTDFKNMRALITAMNNGIANPDNVATLLTTSASTEDYIKPV